jgi:hypothetical protein
MILSPHYLAALTRLAKFALDNERVGYVAAYGNHLLTPDVQIESQENRMQAGTSPQKPLRIAAWCQLPLI